MGKIKVSDDIRKVADSYKAARNASPSVDTSPVYQFSSEVQSFADNVSSGKLRGDQLTAQQKKLSEQASSLAQWAKKNENSLGGVYSVASRVLGGWQDLSGSINRTLNAPLPNYGWNRESPEMIAAAQTGTIGETPDVMALRDAATRLRTGGGDAAFKSVEDYYKVKNTPLDVTVNRADDFKWLKEYKEKIKGYAIANNKRGISADLITDMDDVKNVSAEISRTGTIDKDAYNKYLSLMQKYHLDEDTILKSDFSKEASEYAQQATQSKVYYTNKEMTAAARSDKDFEKLSALGLKLMKDGGALGDYNDRMSVGNNYDTQLKYMTDEQKAIYAYYLAKGGAWQPDGSGSLSYDERRKEADRYYHSIAEDIAYSAAQDAVNARHQPGAIDWDTIANSGNPVGMLMNSARTTNMAITQLRGLRGGNENAAAQALEAAEKVDYLGDLFNTSVGNAFQNIGAGFATMFGEKNDEDYYSPTPSNLDIQRGLVYEKYAGDNKVRKVVADLVMNTGNMAPQILATTIASLATGGMAAAGGAAALAAKGINAAASVATMGMQVYGESYDEGRRMGMDTDQASVYGLLNAGSELALGEIMGKAGRAGGTVLSRGLQRIAPNIDNAVTAVAAKVGKTAWGKYLANVVGEGAEEYMQDVLEPWFKAFATGEEFGKLNVLSADALYSGLIGMLSAGLMDINGVVNIGQEITLYKDAGAQIKRAGTVGQLKSIASTFSADTKAYKLAEKLTESSKPTEIGKALKAVGAALSDQNVASMSEYLQKNYKLPKNSADKLIGFFRDYCSGVELSDEGLELLDVNDEITEAFLAEIVGKNVSGARKNAALQALAQNTNFAEDMARPEQEFNRRNTAFLRFMADTMSGKSSTDTQNAVTEETSAAKKSAEAPSAVQQKAAPKETRTVDASKTSAENVREWLNNSQIVDKRAVDTLVDSYESAGGNQDVLTFVRDAELAYTYGKYNMNESVETAGSPLALTEEQAKQARSLGKMFGWKASMEKQAAVSEESSNAQPNRGTVRFEYDAQNTRLTAREQTSVDVLSGLAQAYGLKLSFFESTMEDGKRVYKTQDGKTVSAPNGYYTSSDGTIHIDVHAGQVGQGVVMYTAAHELTHYIAVWDAGKFRELANFLVEQYGKAGQSVSSYVARQMEKAERQGRTLSYDEAFEEFVADSMETMLADGRVAEKLRALKEKDKTLWQKVKDFFKDFAANLKKLVEQYKDAAPDSEEGKFVASLNRDVIEKLEDLFTEGVAEASENSGKVGSAEGAETVESKESVRLSERFNRGNEDIRYSLRGYTKDGRSVYETDFDDSVSQEERIRLFKERIATVFNLGMVKLNTDTKKIQVQGDKFTWGKTLFGNRVKMSDTERAALINSLYDMADILQHSAYDPKTKSIEPSYSNPNLRPKNPAHKDVKYWYKFRNSIVADGVGYDVTFNIRDKGKEQYEYLIEFKENATPRNSNTVYKDLLLTNSVSQGKNSTTSSKSQEGILRSDRDPNLPVTRAELAQKLMELTNNPIEVERLTDYIANAKNLDELQTKLQKLNSELKKLPAEDKATDNVTKEKIAALRLEAQKTANRLDTYERKLVNLEATAPIKALMQRQSDMAYRRGTQMAERLRGRYTYDRMLDIIKRVGKKLDASKNTERTKEGVRTLAETVVSQSLQFFDKDTGMDAQTMLMGIANMYAELKDSMDTYIEDAYKPEVHLALTELAADLAGRTRQDLTTNELQEMYNVLRAVETSINKAGYLFGKESSTTVRQAAEAVVTEMQAQKQAKPRMAATKRITDFVSKAAWADMKPIYAIRMINSPQLTKMFDALLYDGQNTWIRDVNRGADFMQEAAKKYNFEKWDHKARHEYTDKEGQKISLSLEQMMYLYALIRRGEQAINHLYQGGFVFAEDVTTDAGGKRIAKDPKAHQLTTETMEQIRNKLKTDYPEAARFVEDVQEYLSTVLAKDGNEVSYELYGLNAYGEKNYIPIHSAGDFHARANEVQFQKELGFAQGLANRSFTKRTVRKASNPILLSDFSEVASSHISDMAQYHAFAVPLTNLKKVMAWSERAPDVGGAPESVRSAIRARFGSDAPVKYLDNLVNDLNASPRRDPTETILDKGLSVFKRSAVVASASVAIQQPSAIARTLYVMNPLNFLGAKVEKTKLGKTWDQLCAYSSTAAIKDMGGFDVGMSGSTADYIFGGAQTKGEKVKAGIDAATGFAPEYMDKVTWCTIWNAVKRETKRSNPGLLSNSEEFLKKAGRRFDEIVNLTQVYDSTLTKSQAMRSKSTHMKMITAFMAEPTTSINMLVDGFRQGGKTAVKAVATWTAAALLNSLLASIIYAGRDDDDEKTWVEKYAASFADEMKDSLNPLTAIPLVQDLWNICQGWDVERSDMSVFADIVNGVRRVAQRVSSGKEIGWKDYEETILAAVQALGLPLKNISRDLRAVVQTITAQPLSDTQWYEILSGALPSLFPADKSAKLYYAITNGNTEYAERLRGTYKDDVAYHTGIRTALADTDPRIVQAAQALDSGDLEEYKRLVNAIKSMGFIQDDVVSAVNNKYNEMHKDDSEREFTEGKVSMYKAEHYVASVVGGLGMEDEIFDEIVRAYLVKNADKGYSKEDAEGNVRKSLLKELKEAYVDTGVLDRTKAKTALQKWMSADKAEETLKQWDYSKSGSGEWDDRYDTYYDAILNGGEVKKLKGQILNAGIKEDTLADSVKKRIKQDVSDGTVSRAAAKQLLTRYAGVEEEDVETTLNAWDYMDRHPDTELDVKEISQFYTKYKGTGLPEANFEQYLIKKQACKGIDKDGDGRAESGTKKAQVMAVIDALPVSNEVKDALYFAEDYKASTLYEAPWR